MSQIQYIRDDNFDDLVLNSDALNLVYFSADYCRHCKRYHTLLDSLSNNGNLDFRIGNIDIDESLDLSNQFDIRLLPTTIFFYEGNVVERRVGILSVDEINEVINNV